jgi:alkylation response protein AidB-like acyl-CoA dehydrogenase
MTEVLAPTMIDYATPELAATMVPRLLRGDETWCQGFSEPDTGSNLASLSCRAARTDDGWRVSGQKVWTGLAQFAQRCVLLTRTGTTGSAHKGITALFVDMESPGITVRPIQTMHGPLEFCEVYFDDVAVPFDRTLGEVGQGWSVAMDLLPYERSTSLWHRAAYLHRLAAGERLGPETSIDKVLVATSEQAVFDLVADTLSAEVSVGHDPASERWRSQFLYSRAASIYGGSAEIQRNIISRRLLSLGSDR